jgi:methionyl-tRNA synthetase
VLYASAETLRILAVAIHPIMPAAAGSLWSQLGQSGAVADAHLPAAGVWGGLASGTATTKGESLFPRVEHDEP